MNFYLQEVLQHLQINQMIYLPFKLLIAKVGDAESGNKLGEDMFIGKLNIIDLSQLDLHELN